MKLNTIIRGNSYEVIPEIIKDIKNPIIVSDYERCAII